MTVLGKFDPKSQNCYFKLKNRSEVDVNMQNLTVMLILS